MRTSTLVITPIALLVVAVVPIRCSSQGVLGDGGRLAGSPGGPPRTPAPGARDPWAGNPVDAHRGPSARLSRVEITNDLDTPRTAEVAYGGVAVSRLAGLRSVENLAVIDAAGRSVPAQFSVLSRWGGPLSDTRLPVQWLRVAVQRDWAPGERALYQLRDHAVLPEPAPRPVRLDDTETPWSVDTGVAEFSIDPNNPALIVAARFKDDGPSLLTGRSGGGPRLVLADGTVLGRSAVRIDPGSLAVVERGPLSVSIMQKGHFLGGVATVCDRPFYERFGYTVVLTFTRGTADVDIRFNFRNECGDAYNGPFTDQAITVSEVGWTFTLAGDSDAVHYGGSDAITTVRETPVRVEQRKGGGAPWRRRARVTVDNRTVDSAEKFQSPFLAVSTPRFVASLQMPWMQYREPQALRADENRIAALLVSERQLIAESRGIWGLARLSFATPNTDLEALRARNRAALERGLLVRTPVEDLNEAGVFSSMGGHAPSLVKSEYIDMITTLHDDTVRPGGQWDRAKTYGSQLWPDTQRDPHRIDGRSPADHAASMNYWNPSGATLYEYLRTGQPKWAWDMGLTSSWLQMYSAYCNIGDQRHGNLNGFAPGSGGGGTDGQWHRTGQGSDDYSYNRGMHLAYLIRPDPILRDRFGQAGQTVVDRFGLPKSQENRREKWVNAVEISRLNVQWYEMLLNCAQFVPGRRGEDCAAKIREIAEELAQDNLRPGVMCSSDIPSSTCQTPQQFMQNAMMYGFFMRYYRNFGDAGGVLRRSLVDIAINYYRFGLEKEGDGRSIRVNTGFAAGFSCNLSADGNSVRQCTATPDSDDRLTLYEPSRGHSLALLLMGHELDPKRAQLCEVTRSALDHPDIYGAQRQWVIPGTGFYKGASQIMQHMVFAVGAYDSCTD